MNATLPFAIVVAFFAAGAPRVHAQPAPHALSAHVAAHTQSELAPGVASDETLAAEAERLAAEFSVQLRAHQQRRLDLSRGGRTPDPAQLGPHPAHEFAPRFSTLVERGSVRAHVWWIEQLAELVDASQSEERARVLARHSEALVEAEPGGAAMNVVLDALRTFRDALGIERADALAEHVASASANAEIRARAIWTRAVLRTPAAGLPATPPGDVAERARFEEALELYRLVVASWPKTAAARDAAAALYSLATREVGERLASWVASCAERERAGVALDEWPPAPLAVLEPEFLALAAAQHGLAERWLHTFYARWQDHMRLSGPRIALMELAHDLCFDYPDPSVRLTGVGLALYELLFRASAEHGGYLSFVLDDFQRDAERMPVDALERAVLPLRARNTDPHVHAVLLHALVRSALGTGEYRNYVRALAWRDELLSRAPADALVAPTTVLCAPVEALLDGRPAPELSARDTAGELVTLASLRGKVVLVVFFNLFADPKLPDARAWQEFQRAHAAESFTILGVNAGPMDARGLTLRLASQGATWRNLLVPNLQDELLARWQVKRYPTTVVVDADGVLRGRDRAWSELEPLLVRLVGEAAARPR